MFDVLDSDLDDDLPRCASGRKRLLVLPPPTFHTCCARARPGEGLVYYRGYLAID
jgi:hypothetical protein